MTRRADRQDPSSAIKPFTSDELEALLAAMADKWPAFYPFILFLGRTGLRWGEAVELKWADIDFQSRRAAVARAFSRGAVKKPKGGRTRWVDLSQQVVRELELLRTLRKKETLAYGWDGVPELIFVTSTGTRLNHSNFRSNVWLKALKAAGLPHHGIHDLRHTFATQLLAHRASILYVQNQMGHASAKMTLDTYAHWLPEDGETMLVDALDSNPRGSAKHSHN